VFGNGVVKPPLNRALSQFVHWVEGGRRKETAKIFC
jgi:hypothetical protein